MDFPSTQLVGDDSSVLSQNTSITEGKIQIGILELGSQKFQIFNGVTKVGRHPACEICLPDETVSKTHAEIEADGKAVFVCDLNSSNKTRLNGHILRPQRFYSVQDGASLTFGIINTRFFLVHPEDSSLLAPETPDRDVSIQSQQDNSLIDATPRPNDDTKFRRPFPVRSSNVPKQLLMASTSNQSQSPSSTKTYQDSGRSNNNDDDDDDDADIQNMETQVSSTEPNIQDLETQAISRDNETNENEARKIVKQNNLNGKLSIEDMETQKMNVDEIASTSTSDQQEKMENVETQINSGALDIQDLETQSLFEKPEDGERTKQKPLEKLQSKRLSQHQRNIEEIKTQIFGADEEVQSSDDEEIHDLPTQTNADYSEALKSKKSSKENSRCEASSPDLLANPTNYIIADSDEETDEEGLFQDVQRKTNEQLIASKNLSVSGNNAEDETDCDKINDNVDTLQCNQLPLSGTRSNEDKLKRNGFISDSDSDGEDNSKSRSSVKGHKRKAQSGPNDQANSSVLDDGSDTDFDENEMNLLNNSKSRVDAKESSQNVSENSKNSEKKSSESLKPDHPREVLEMPEVSKNTGDCDSGSDDPYSAPTQFIIPPKTHEIPKSPQKSTANVSASSATTRHDSDFIDDSENDDEADSTQIIDMENLKKAKNQDTDDLEQTQVIPMPSTSGYGNAELEDTIDSLAPTQKIDIPARVNKQVQRVVFPDPMEDDNFAPTQQIHIPSQIEQQSERSVFPDSIDDLAPTQIIHRLQDDEPTVENYMKELQATSDDDLAPTQLTTAPINVRPSTSTKIKSNEVDNTKSKNNTSSTEKRRSRSIEIVEDSPENTKSSERKAVVPSKEDISAPSTSRRLRSTRIEKKEVKDVKDVPVTKREKFNLSLRNRKEADSASEEAEKSTDSHANSSLDDSVDKNLDSIFGGESNDKMNLDVRSPLMTQQVLDTLQPTQQPENNTEPETSSRSTRSSRRDGKKNKESQEESQDAYFKNLKGKKRKISVLESQQNSDDEENVKAKPGTSKTVENISSPISSRKSVRLSLALKTKKSVSDKKIAEDSPRIENLKAHPLPNSPASSLGSFKSSSSTKLIDESSERGKQSSSDVKNKTTYDSGSDDSDFEKISAMADACLAMPPRKSPRRPRKGNNQTSIGGSVTDKKSATKPTSSKRKLKEPESLAGESTHKAKEIVETPKRRASWRNKPAEESVVAISDRIGTPKLESNYQKTEEMGRKRGRPKKSDEENQVAEKRRRMGDNDEVSPESQEVQEIFTGVDTLERVGRGKDQRLSTAKAIQGKTAVQTPKSGKNSVTDSPSSSVRSKKKVEETSIHHQVLLTKIDDHHEEISTSVANLGGTIATDPLKATILVTDKIRRTYKFFIAVARSIPIVTIAWLEASKKARRFVNPEKYLLQDPENEEKFGFNLKKSLAKASKEKMLSDYCIYISSNITGPTIPEIKTMIEVSGGKALTRLPKKWPQKSVIVTCLEDLPGILKNFTKTGNKVPVVNMEFLLSGILRQKVSYDEFTF